MNSRSSTSDCRYTFRYTAQCIELFSGRLELTVERLVKEATVQTSLKHINPIFAHNKGNWLCPPCTPQEVGLFPGAFLIGDPLKFPVCTDGEDIDRFFLPRYGDWGIGPHFRAYLVESASPRRPVFAVPEFVVKGAVRTAEQEINSIRSPRNHDCGSKYMHTVKN